MDEADFRQAADTEFADWIPSLINLDDTFREFEKESAAADSNKRRKTSRKEKEKKKS